MIVCFGHLFLNVNFCGKLNFILQADDAGMWHQIWYEDEQSLSFKYNLVKDLNLGGECTVYGHSQKRRLLLIFIVFLMKLSIMMIAINL